SLPVGTFAVQRPADFTKRLGVLWAGSGSNEEAFGSLRTSAVKHVRMFNWSGDMNGRHNLPGAPMLDWLVAALFFAGLGSCVLRAHRWQYFLPVIWFGVALSGGVFSMISEAPQSHRTLENSIVTALLAAVFLSESFRMVEERTASDA